MRLQLPSALLAFALLTVPFVARAVTVTVPTNYATITAAIASGADVIKVKNGDYTENLTISRALELCADDQVYAGSSMAFPTVHGTLLLNQPLATSGDPIVIRGLHITGSVSDQMNWTKAVYFHECRLDGGITGGSGTVGSVSLRGCIVRGDVTVNPYYLEVTCSTLIGGGVTANYEGDGYVRDNYIVGPATVGVNITANDGGGVITNNLVVGTTDGIVYTDPTGASASYNTVENVTGHAYRVVKSPTANMPVAHLAHNVATAPAGDGFNLTGGVDVSYCTVTSAGANGISASGSMTILEAVGNVIHDPGAAGIIVSGSTAYATTCNYNEVYNAGGPGISLPQATNVRYNVVGRSAGNGIDVADEQGTLTVRNNTTYLNTGDGLRVGGSATTSVLNNISAGNQLDGLNWLARVTPILGCNDWFGNIAGTVRGTPAGASDVFVSPGFCNLPHDDVELSAGSPLVGTLCGLIGARGVGCASPVGVPPSAGTGAIGFAVGANPARGLVSFAWRTQGEPGRLEVYDASGARVWSRDVPAGTSAVEWGAAGVRGLRPAPGVYFARLSFGARVEQRRLVVLR